MIFYPFLWSVVRPPIPVFDGDKWCPDGGKTLAELGYTLPNFVTYDEFQSLVAMLPNIGESEFANYWNGVIVPTFDLKYHDRVPAFQEVEALTRHLRAHFNINMYSWCTKWVNAYAKIATLTSEDAETETITHSENGTKNNTSKTNSSATMSANGTKTTAETNSPQVLADLETKQNYIDNYSRGTDDATSTASNEANSTADGTVTRDYTHTRKLMSAFGKLPIELQEAYVTKMRNLTEEIINSFEKFFVGDMLYV